jgi:hypothetical protein
VSEKQPPAPRRSDWRDEPLLPEQTSDDRDRDDERDGDEAASDRRLRDDVPPHHGNY